jgi:hypothetical protein
MVTKKRTVKDWNLIISDLKDDHKLDILRVKNEFNDRLNQKDDKISSLQHNFDYQLEIALKGINNALFTKKLELKERDEFIDRLVRSFKGIEDVTKLLGEK